MAVSSCKSYDETASWRSEDDVINLTKTASNAGDFFPNQHLDENCNNSNNKTIYTFNATEENSKVSGIKLNFIETTNTEVLSKNLENLGSCKNTKLSQDTLHEKTLLSAKENKMKLNLLEMPVDCQDNMENDKNMSLSSELTSQINKIKEDISETKTTNLVDQEVGLTQQTLSTTVELSHQVSNRTNVDDDFHSVHAEEMEVRDPDWTEERFRVDRRKLENMLQGNCLA